MTVVVYLFLVAVPSRSMVHGLGAGSPRAWLTIAWLVGLGMVATQLLGAILGSMAASPRVASHIALVVMALVAVSGIFYPLTALLPQTAAMVEVEGSWRTRETAGTLLGWALLGLLAAPLVLRRMARRECGSRVAERQNKTALHRAV